MGFKRIIVHAGLSKTGSTSIQANCERHRDLLRANGALYPRFSFGDHVFDNHSAPLTLAISDSPGRYALGVRERFGEEMPAVTERCRSQFREILQTEGETLVLSSERVAGYDPEDLENLRDQCEAACDRLSVLLYLRSPFELLESILQERAKAGARVDPQSIAGRSMNRYLRLREVFDESLQVVNYHRARQEPGGLVAGFLRYCGIPSAKLEGLHFGRENTRVSREAFLLMNAVNEAFPKREQDRHGVERTAGDLRPLYNLAGQAFVFPWKPDSPEYVACLGEYEWFQQELGQDFPSPPQDLGSLLWQAETREELPGVLEQIGSLPIRNFLESYLRENDVDIHI